MTFPEIAPEARAWWEATRSGVLLIQFCVSCGHHQHYPRALCLECGSTDLDWVEASGLGTVYSFTVSHQSPDPESLEPPYVVAIIQLDEGPRLLSHVTARPPSEISCDQQVRLAWRALGDGRHLPVFKTYEKEGTE